MRLQSDGEIGVPEMKPSHVQLNFQYVAVYRQAETNGKLEHQPTNMAAVFHDRTYCGLSYTSRNKFGGWSVIGG